MRTAPTQSIPLTSSDGAGVPSSRRSSMAIGIDVTCESIQVTALQSGSNKESRVVGTRVVADWEVPCRPDSSGDVAAWVDKVCRVLQEHMPPCTRPMRNQVMLSLPVSWLHFEIIDGSCDPERRGHEITSRSAFGGYATSMEWSLCGTGAAHEVGSLEPFNARTTASPGNARASAYKGMLAVAPDNASLPILQTLMGLGYRVSGIVPDCVAIANQISATTGLDSPCIVSLHRDGGNIAICEDGRVSLIRSLPAPVGPRTGSRGEPQETDELAEVDEFDEAGPSNEVASPTHASTQRHNELPIEKQQAWRRQVIAEIESTLAYHAQQTDQPNLSKSIDAEHPIVIAGTFFDSLSGENRERSVEQWSATIASELRLPVAVWESPQPVEPIPVKSEEGTFVPNEDEPPLGETIRFAGSHSLASLATHNTSATGLFSLTGRVVRTRRGRGHGESVNLLPDAFHREESYQRLWFMWSSTATVACMGLLVLTVLTFRQVSDRHRLHERTSAIIQPIQKHFEKLKGIETQLAHRISEIESTHRYRPTGDVLQLLGAISHANKTVSGDEMEEVQLESVDADFRSRDIRIKGISINPESLAKMVDELHQTHWVKSSSAPEPATTRLRRVSRAQQTEKSKELTDVEFKQDGRFVWAGEIAEGVRQVPETTK